jgi:nucleotide-binding universal stress UspA family protein
LQFATACSQCIRLFLKYISLIQLFTFACMLASVLLGKAPPVKRVKGGNMFRDILIVFDDQEICPEALAYGREFALRMNVRVIFLMLVRMSSVGQIFLDTKRTTLSRIENRAAKLLSQSSETYIQQGIEVSSVLKVGEPAQELLKFIADRPPFLAIIWGSGSDLPGKGHWISRVSGKMDCPLLTVSRKGRL